ncbi:MAG TPA: hypothetical protein VF527_12830 [Pyrinomonadaceae bacterium]
MEVGLAASAVNICGGAKIIVKTKIAPTAAPSAFKAFCDFGVLDFLISKVSLRRRRGACGMIAPDNRASSPNSSAADDAM